MTKALGITLKTFDEKEYDMRTEKHISILLDWDWWDFGLGIRLSFKARTLCFTVRVLWLAISFCGVIARRAKP
jgi:hypothetical protein